jgi:hypothetical protein
MTTPGYWTSLSLWEMESISRPIGSNSWPKGKWRGSPGSMFRGRCPTSPKFTLHPLKGKKMSWDWSIQCPDGSRQSLSDPPPIMVCCLNMLKSQETREWLERSFNSDNLNITYRTSASESPILRWNSTECPKPRLPQKGGWSWPILTSSHPISTSSPPPSPEEGKITDSITTLSNGTEWTHSR